MNLRHYGIILGRGKMRQAERVPEHDVGVVERFVWAGGDPGWDALRRLARGLRHVAAGGMDLVVVVWSRRCQCFCPQLPRAAELGGAYIS